MVDGDGEPQRQPAPGAGPGRRGPRRPARAPARRRRPPTRRTTRPSGRRGPHRGARGSADDELGTRPAKLIDGGRDGVRTEQGPAVVVRRWWALNAAAKRASRGSAGVRATRPTTVSASSMGQHPIPVQAPSIPASPSAVSMSSSAEATMRLAPARSRCETDDVRSPRLDGDRGPVCGRARRIGDGTLQQACVPVVHHPVLRPGQPRREPAAHRAAAAAEVVDHEGGGRSEVPSKVLGELGRPRRRVGRLAQDKPLRLTGTPCALTYIGSRSALESDLLVLAPRSSRRPARTPARTWVVSGHPYSDARRSRAARRRRRAARRRRARSAARRRGPPGRRAGPAARQYRRPRARGLGHPADLGGEHRQAAGQCLGDDHAVRLGVRRAPAGPRRRTRGRAPGPCAVPRSAPGRPAAVQRVAAHAVGEHGVANQAACTHAAPGQVRRHRERVEQHVVPLSGVNAATHSRAPPAAVPERGRGVDARLGHVHSVGRQRVQLPQPAPSPCAGRDDGGGRSRTSPSRAWTAPASSGARWPSGIEHDCRSRRACGTSARGRRTRSARRAAPRCRPESVGRRPPGQHAPPRPVAARRRARRARAPPRPARRALGGPDGRTCCRRSAALGRRRRSGR